jgi:hypothetical protein
MRRRNEIDSTAGKTARDIHDRPLARRKLSDATAGRSARQDHDRPDPARPVRDATNPEYDDPAA